VLEILLQGLIPKEDESLDSIENAVEDEISSTAEVGEVCFEIFRN
jgi:hypothetical protein